MAETTMYGAVIGIALVISMIIGMGTFADDIFGTYNVQQTQLTTSFNSIKSSATSINNQIQSKIAGQNCGGPTVLCSSVFIIGNLLFFGLYTLFIQYPLIAVQLFNQINTSLGAQFGIPGWVGDFIALSIAAFFIFRLIQLAFNRQTEV